MTKEEQLNFLITKLRSEEPSYFNAVVPDNYEEQRGLLRALMNVRPPRQIDAEFLRVQDEFLTAEVHEKGIVDADELPPIEKDDRICLWRGDITTLAADAIVNAANDQLLGCFVPCHHCIDNAIHSAAGIQLRLKCDEIMKKQKFAEPTGSAKITGAYNLPCKYVLHTVGPIISGSVTEYQCEQLADCYRSCLKLAEQNRLNSIAFCCISTGEFAFPRRKAAEIAVKTVYDFLNTHSNYIGKVIFNVFTGEDFATYKDLLG
jgi:O-acetyl-ADP-ribose deacetylase (regulator of RNase III)